jgi:hypothetical protein
VAIGCLAGGASAASASPPGADVPSALETLAAPLPSVIRQRSQHFYRMPDGSIWDGANYHEFSQLLRRNLEAYTIRKRGETASGSPFVEYHGGSIEWRFRKNASTEAWDIFAILADEERGALRGSRIDTADGRRFVPLLETANRHNWTNAPPLWTSRDAGDFTWEFAFVDERQPDPYTRRVHGSYLRITRVWGDGQLEIEGYSLDRGTIRGIVTVPDPARQVRRDRLLGAFFLWPEEMVREPGGYLRRSWRYLPAEDLRLSPEALADALIDDAAEIAEWRFQRVSGRQVWHRTVRPVEFIQVQIPSTITHVPPPPVGQEGPDLLVLRDGRWFRGRLVRQDDQTVTFAATVGDLEAEFRFTLDEVAVLQSPEER